jgi:hypothetical protein
METWTQQITAPRQPDFGSDLSAANESQGGPRLEVAEDPPLSRPIEVSARHGGRIQVLLLAISAMVMVALTVLLIAVL